MIIDLVGVSYVGKTTMIEALQRGSPIEHIDLAGKPVLSEGLGREDLRILKGRPYLRDTVRYLIVRGRFSLAARFLRFWRWQATSAAEVRSNLAVRDENLIKKMFAPTPLTTSQQALSFWTRFATAQGSNLLRASFDGADVLVFLTIDEAEFLRRFHKRHGGDADREAVVARFRVESQCLRAIHAAGSGDRRLFSLDISDLADGVARFLDIVKAVEQHSGNAQPAAP